MKRRGRAYRPARSPWTKSCAQTGAEVAQRLSRLGHWEFEDYTE